MHFHSIQFAFITPALNSNWKEEINKKTKELFKAAGGDEENMQGLVPHDKVGSLALCRSCCSPAGTRISLLLREIDAQVYCRVLSTSHSLLLLCSTSYSCMVTRPIYTSGLSYRFVLCNSISTCKHAHQNQMFPNAYVLLDFVTGHRGLFSYCFRGAAVRHGQYLGGHLCHVNNRFHPRVRLLL